MTAATHNIVSEAERLEEQFGENEILPRIDHNARLFQPPAPIGQQESNWPLLTVSKGFFEGAMAARNAGNQLSAKVDIDMSEGVADTWGDDAKLDLDDDDQNEKQGFSGQNDDVGGDEGAGAKGWDVDDDLDIPADISLPNVADANGDHVFVAPTKGLSKAQNWINTSKIPVDHILAGSFETAMRLLHDQIGVVQFDEYKDIFLQTYARSRTYIAALPSLTSLPSFPLRNPKEPNTQKQLPAIGLKLNDLVQRLQQAYQFTTNGKFQESIDMMRSILLSVPLLCLDTKQEVAEAQQMVEICREYIVGLQMEIYRKELPKDSLDEQKRVCEVNILVFAFGYFAIDRESFVNIKACCVLHTLELATDTQNPNTSHGLESILQIEEL